MNSAVAVFQGTINGTVHFTQSPRNTVKIDVNINGLSKNAMHGFHVHQYGDLTDGCTSMCAHYNPFDKTHGGPFMENRHVGDLGNLYTDKDGVANYTFYDNVIQLEGAYSIIGRGLIIHENPDDCGQGMNKESLITGNAGKRIACAVIGYAKNC
jgi:Cu-Zn family superoxide dismutase